MEEGKIYYWFSFTHKRLGNLGVCLVDGLSKQQAERRLRNLVDLPFDYNDEDVSALCIAIPVQEIPLYTYYTTQQIVNKGYKTKRLSKTKIENINNLFDF